jgi:hypothetical protein
MKLQLAAVLSLALVGGVIGWYVPRRRRRSFYEQPVGMSDRRYGLIKQTRRVFRRLATALLCAALGAAVGWMIAVLLHLP